MARSREGELRSRRRLAGGLLALALLAAGGGALLQSRGIAWAAWLRAAGEAAAVGGLADWFAVVALFRHPLGQRWIPHTAIIPANKARIADNLAGFVRDQFLEPQALVARLRLFDPAERLAQWLGEPARLDGFARRARQFGLRALDWLDDSRLRDASRRLLLDALQRWDAARSAGQLLELLTRDGRHQQLLDEALGRVGDYLARDEVKQRLSALMVRHARQQWPAVTALVDSVKSVDSMGDYLADRLARALLQELQDILQQPDHPLRADYDDKARQWIERLLGDPALQGQLRDLKARLLDQPTVQAYADALAREARDWLAADLAREDSTLALRLRGALAAFGSSLGADPALRQAINDHVLDGASRLAAQLREALSAHIAHTVRAWDDATMVRELELSIGKDLQAIRLNGTLVGALAGLALHAVLQWAPVVPSWLH